MPSDGVAEDGLTANVTIDVIVRSRSGRSAQGAGPYRLSRDLLLPWVPHPGERIRLKTWYDDAGGPHERHYQHDRIAFTGSFQIWDVGYDLSTGRLLLHAEVAAVSAEDARAKVAILVDRDGFVPEDTGPRGADFLRS